MGMPLEERLDDRIVTVQIDVIEKDRLLECTGGAVEAVAVIGASAVVQGGVAIGVSPLEFGTDRISRKVVRHEAKGGHLDEGERAEPGEEGGTLVLAHGFVDDGFCGDADEGAEFEDFALLGLAHAFEEPFQEDRDDVGRGLVAEG